LKRSDEKKERGNKGKMDPGHGRTVECVHRSEKPGMYESIENYGCSLAVPGRYSTAWQRGHAAAGQREGLAELDTAV
jgi:hypothetical protein